MSLDTLHPTQLLMFYYGTFLYQWAAFECMLDMAIGRELKITNRQTVILCANMAYAAKMDTLIGLLNESQDANEVKISGLRKVQNEANRNHLVHSLLFRPHDFSWVSFVKRSVKNGKFSAISKKQTGASMQRHARTMQANIVAVDAAFGFTLADRDDYLKAHEIDPATL